MRAVSEFRHAVVHQSGLSLLKEIGCTTDPTCMFKAPSRAKGSPLYLAAQKRAAKSSASLDKLMDDALLASRVEHFIAIGGNAARDYFLRDHCRLDSVRIGKLSRRMPPFIKAKLQDLYAGSANVDANPTGAFDTDGWGELRTRLPRFAAVLQNFTLQRCPASQTPAGCFPCWGRFRSSAGVSVCSWTSTRQSEWA